MSDLSDEAQYAWDFGFPETPLQRRLSVNSGYDYDGVVESMYDHVSSSQPVLTAKAKSSLRDLASNNNNNVYSYYDSKKAWDEDDMYGLGANFNHSPLPQSLVEPEPTQLPQQPSSRRAVGDISRSFFMQMNKDAPESKPEPVSGLAVMYQRPPPKKTTPLTAQDSMRLRNEARDLAKADPKVTGGFYDISSEVAPRAPPPAPLPPVLSRGAPVSGASLMRSADVSWSSVPEIATESNDKNKTDADSDDNAVAELYADNAIQVLVAFVNDRPVSEAGDVKLVSEEPVADALQKRPEALKPSHIYTGAPMLSPTPVLRRESADAGTKRRASTVSVASTASGYDAEEVVNVTYASGETQQSGLLDLLRMHFLNGHNAMLVVASTQRANAVGEDLVATTVSTVFREAQSMGPQFTNELAVSAYALLPDARVANLLPTTEQEAKIEKVGLAANPVSGTVIHNYRPVEMANEGQATYLGRAAVQNARVLGLDPYVDKDAMMCVTLHLKQTRSSAAPVDAAAAGPVTPSKKAAPPANGEASGESRDVYVSCLKVLFVGSNVSALSQILEKEPEAIWPMVRQSFGGSCRTCITVLLCRDDSPAHSDHVLRFADSLRQFENEAPRSGSVRTFLCKVQQSNTDNAAIQDSVSITRFREDADNLLHSPDALPAFYPLPGTQGRVRKSESSVMNKIHSTSTISSTGSNRESYESASRVIVLKQLKPLVATEERAARVVTPPKLPTPKPPTPKPPTPREPTPKPPTPKPPTPVESTPRDIKSNSALMSPPEELVATRPIAVETVVVPAKPRQIVVEKAPRSAGVSSDNGIDDIHVDMPSSVRVREHDARKMESARRRLQQATAEKWPTLRIPDVGRGGSDSTRAAGDDAKPPQSVASRLRDEWQNSKVYSSQKPLPDPDTPFRTVVLVFNHNNNEANEEESNVLIQRTDDTHVLLTMPPQPPSNERVKCRFQVDEVRSASEDVDATVSLMLSFSSLERLQEAFTVKQLNAAVLVSDITGFVQPFRSQPVWATFHSTLHNVVELRQRGAEVEGALPFKVTLFASVLRGKKLLKDLVEPICEAGGAASQRNHGELAALAASRSVCDPASGNVRTGISPLFGALLYETRGVDVADTGLVAPYLTSILQLADDVAADDPEAFLVLTCVQQTATRLSRAELTEHEAGEGRFYDARFSSYTLISTRSRVDMYEQGLQGNPTHYPIHLFQDAMEGKFKTVCVLTVDQEQADPDSTMRALLMQHKAKTLATTRYQIRKETLSSGAPRSPSQSPRTLAHRHNSVRAYVNECESAARALRDRIADSENGLTDDARAALAAKAATYEELAQQHMVYLTEPSGYELLTYRAVSPGLQVDASQLVEPVASTSLDNIHRTQSPTPSAPAKKSASSPQTAAAQRALPVEAAAAPPPAAAAAAKQTRAPTATATATKKITPVQSPAPLPAPPAKAQSLSRSIPAAPAQTDAPAPALAQAQLPASPPSTKRYTPHSMDPPRPSEGLSSPQSLGSTMAPATPGTLLSGSIRSTEGSARHPGKLNSQASTKPPSTCASADDRANSLMTGAPRSLLTARATRSGSTNTSVDRDSPGLVAGPQLTPQRLPAEAGLTSRSMVLLATDVALTKMLLRQISHRTGDDGAHSLEGPDTITIAETGGLGELVIATEREGSPFQQTFKFDDVVCLSAATEAVTQSNLSEVHAHAGAAMPPSIPSGVNPNSLFKSPVLVAGLQGFLAGSNVSIVLQESTEASHTTLLEQLLRMIVGVCTRERPAEATLFLSSTFVKEDQSIDLITAPNPNNLKPYVMSFSPLAGPFISSSEFQTLWTPQSGQDAVTKTLRADANLGASVGGHLLVITIWQKLVIEAEGDVSLSSITIVAGRGAPSVLRQYLKDPRGPLKVLLRYVLGGPCYSICATCVTDAEDGETALGEKNTALYMLAYQTSQLCNVSGRPVSCNSYRDLLRYHKAQLKKIAESISTQTAELNAMEMRIKSEGSSPRKEESLAKRRAKLASSTQQSKRFTEMVQDEIGVLKTAAGGVSKEVHDSIPPYYSAMPS